MDGPVDEAAPSPGDIEPEGRPSSRRIWFIVAAVSVVVVVVVIAGVLVMARPEPTYDDATQQRFVEACVVDGGEPVRPACTCLYVAITERIPYDRFVEVDDQLRAAVSAGQPIVLPDDIAALVPACQIPA